MKRYPQLSKSTLFRVILVVVVILVLSVSVFWYLWFSSVAPPVQLSDPVGDVDLSLGSSYPRMVDLTGGRLNVNGSLLSVNVTVADSVAPAKGNGESVDWIVLLVVENDTDALQTYQVQLTLNSTGFYGVLQNVGTGQSSTCDAQFNRNMLIVHVSLPELLNATKVEWNVNSSYSNSPGDELVAYASDAAPNRGTVILVF